jgi:hypothetical protein
MKKLSLVLLLVMSLGVVSAGVVQASSISMGIWYDFQWETLTSNFGVAGGGTNGTTPAPNPSWTYSGASIVTIVDSYLMGDMFTLWDNGSPVGTTSAVGNAITDTFYNGNGPVEALTHTELSRGFFNLAGGSHALDIEIFQTAFGNTGGVAFFRVDAAPVPLPPSALLLGSGLLGLVGWRRFRKA